MKSKTGRELPPLPILKQTRHGGNKWIKEMVKWLIEQAKLEATEHELMLIQNVRTNKKGYLTVADDEMLHLIIFNNAYHGMRK